MKLTRQDAECHLIRALGRNPVVGLLGPRQVGKTTLARDVTAGMREVSYLDLEDSEDLLRLENPRLALEPLHGVVVIDEVQRRPELFPLLRILADRPECPARFLVLGSASPELLRQSSETLAGRIEYIELGGFALAETGSEQMEKLWNRGGFPRAFTAVNEDDSQAWRRNFIRTFLERDLPQLGLRLAAPVVERFWMMLAHLHGQILNVSELGRNLGFSPPSARHYVDTLAAAFMVRLLPPWHENLGKRQVKSPKVYIRDSGLLHSLLGLNDLASLRGHPRLGASWEGFVIEQILLAAPPDARAYFWATQGGAELDLLLLTKGKRIGIEVKYAEAPRPTRSLHIAINDLRLDHARIIYPGRSRIDLDEKLAVLPLANFLEELPNEVHTSKSMD